jgi:hypothetical protein
LAEGRCLIPGGARCDDIEGVDAVVDDIAMFPPPPAFTSQRADAAHGRTGGLDVEEPRVSPPARAHADGIAGDRGEERDEGRMLGADDVDAASTPGVRWMS